MDLLDHRGRVLRLVVSAVIGAAVGVGFVWLSWQVLPHDSSGGPGWFSMFAWSTTFVLVTIGMNALLSTIAKRRWRLPIPVARVVRR